MKRIERRVPQARVDRFAARQSLRITAANESRIVGYLATTRRWRSGGLLLSIVVTAVITSGRSDDTSGITFIGLFVGWFVGAVVAEWRVSSVLRPLGVQRAVLAPRTDRDYLSNATWWAARLVLAAALAVAIIGQAFTSRHLAMLGLTVVLVAAAAAVRIVTRRVLVRSQPAGRPDVLAADDAIRSRSLYVLHGSLLAICGYVGAVAAELGVAYDSPFVTSSLGHVLAGFVGMVAMVSGFLVARAPRPLPRRIAEAVPGPVATT